MWSDEPRLVFAATSGKPDIDSQESAHDTKQGSAGRGARRHARGRDGGGAGRDRRPRGAAPAPTPQALGPTTTHDLEFVPVEPCRLADTRQSGGIVANNTGRNFLIKGSTGIAAQGGNSGGCGIPEGALAAELTIISASASGPGLLRAYPFGGVPTATILAYQSGATC